MGADLTGKKLRHIATFLSNTHFTHFHHRVIVKMRFTTVTTLLLLSFASLSLARYSDEGLAVRDFDDVVLDAREVLDELGFHARALQDAALSTRRLEHLEARMADLEEA
ncbi:hypothetical protein FA13DRAFT_1799899, partial [Coprinellus micaceus]